MTNTPQDRMKTPDTTEARLDAFLSEFELDEQERILRYALDHIVPRLKSRAALASEAQGARSAEAGETSVAPDSLQISAVWHAFQKTPEYERAMRWAVAADREGAFFVAFRAGLAAALATHPAHPQVAAVVTQEGTIDHG